MDNSPRIYRGPVPGPMWPERKRLRLEGVDYGDPGRVYFATLCARGFRQPFADPRLAAEVVKALDWSRANGRWFVFCYCLMLDHLHLALSPGPAGWSLSESFRAFKRWTTRQAWACGIHGKLWQRGWYDHIVRREECLEEIFTYIIYNPVRKGLADEPDAWAYSGYRDVVQL